MKKSFLMCMAFMVMTILGCGDSVNYSTSTPYEVSFYIDTIADHVILTTVCNYTDNSCLSTSSLSLGMVDSTKINSRLWK